MRRPEVLLRQVKVPKTWYITSDWILHFVHHNELEDVLNWKYMEIEQVRQEYPASGRAVQEFVVSLRTGQGTVSGAGRFRRPAHHRAQFQSAGRPRRLGVLRQIQKPVSGQSRHQGRASGRPDGCRCRGYASIFGPDPTEYRAERGLLDVHEEMGIMVQEVVGQEVGKYFFPACSGVAFSNNEFRWSARISRSDGLIRLVPGLGTRAVDRVVDDYPVLIAPGQPNSAGQCHGRRDSQVLASPHGCHQS